MRTCGSVAGGGRTWQITVNAVACADAKKLVGKLMPKVQASGTVRLGTYLGMRCNGLGGTSLGNAKARGINCNGVGGKQLIAIGK
ncbi:MAG: hypothetical protein QOF43_862 [Gaiellaceae bacterium]|nr:hypothetical protein [Gaiellaceae bacterium]